MRPATRVRIPTWDMVVGPFEPLDLASAKNLMLRVAFLLAITSFKRVGDLQSRSVSPMCLEFAPVGVKAILHPRSGYVPKVPSSMALSTVMQAFICYALS